MNRSPLVSLVVTTALVLGALSPTADAQRGSRGLRVRRLPYPQDNLFPKGMGPGARLQFGPTEERPTILLTGYWPPTNEMIRRFSTSSRRNPDGWVGSDWEGRGYDVHAFFPEFPNGIGQGEGDLEVDYQDTSADFWRIANSIRPIAVITFSLGDPAPTWELEMTNRNLAGWIPDYESPTQPTPTPPDASVPAGTVRPSALPVQDVVDAVNAASIPGLQVFIDIHGHGGGFLSEFIAYHGVWYQSRHADPTDPDWCVAAGHVHVGIMVGKKKAVQATHQTLRAVIRYVDEVTGYSGGDTEWFCPPKANSATFGSLLTPLGTNSVSSADLELLVVETVPHDFGVAFYGAHAVPGMPMGNGKLCIGSPLYRLPHRVHADGDGFARYALDFASPPLSGGMSQITPGSTWRFQYWLRDPAGGGAGFNLSSGLAITFAP